MRAFATIAARPMPRTELGEGPGTLADVRERVDEMRAVLLEAEKMTEKGVGNGWPRSRRRPDEWPQPQ